MRGVRFYLEYETPAKKNKATRKEPGNHEGNVFAAFFENGVHWSLNHTEEGKPYNQACYEGAGAVYFRPNSPVASTSASLDFLRDNCLHISEQQAREIHPALFDWLDQSKDPEGEKEG